MGEEIQLPARIADVMTEDVRSYRDLVAWQRARALVAAVYQQTSGFPSDERFGLISQLRRCAVSIPSNIAEGYGRGAARDYARFLRVARGSLFELETQLILAVDLGSRGRPPATAAGD